MKKIMTLVIAAAAISLASCGGKTNSNTAELDSLTTETVAEEEVAPAEQAGQVVALLQEQIKNADPEQIKAIGAQVAEKVAEFLAKGDEAAAKTYTETINKFIAENAEKLKAIGASTTISEALSNVENLPSSLLEAATSAANGVAATATEQAEAAQQAVDAAKAAVEAAPEAVKEAAKEAAKEAVDAAKAKGEEAAAAAQQKAQEQANKAIDDAAAAAGKTAVTAYTFVEGSNGFGGEGAENLWDGDTATKFCTNEFPVVSVVELDGVYTVNGFTMATANDNADYNGRNPNDWTISVSADGENWTELAKGDDTFFEETNFTYYNGDASAEGVSFVKFEAASTAANLFQVSELTLYGEKTAEKGAADEALDEKAEAPQTFDFGIIAAVAAVVSLGGFAVAKKRK